MALSTRSPAAVKAGAIGNMRLLLNEKANVKFASHITGDSALHYAVCSGASDEVVEQLVSELIKAGADPAARNRGNMTYIELRDLVKASMGPMEADSLTEGPTKADPFELELNGNTPLDTDSSTRTRCSQEQPLAQ